MAKVDISNIVSVYSGKPGCMCGCNGKHSTTDRSIKIIAGKVLNHPDVVYEDNFAYVETDTRNLVVYFKEAA